MGHRSIKGYGNEQEDFTRPSAQHFKEAPDAGTAADTGRKSGGLLHKGDFGMARPKRNALMIAVALLPIGCDRGPDRDGRNSVTVSLPPAWSQTPAPGFSFDTKSKLGPRNEPLRSTEAVRRSVQ